MVERLKSAPGWTFTPAYEMENPWTGKQSVLNWWCRTDDSPVLHLYSTGSGRPAVELCSPCCLSQHVKRDTIRLSCKQCGSNSTYSVTTKRLTKINDRETFEVWWGPYCSPLEGVLKAEETQLALEAFWETVQPQHEKFWRKQEKDQRRFAENLKKIETLMAQS